MTDSTVASDLLQTFDVHCDFSAQITFYGLSLIDYCTDFLYFVICQITAACIRINTCFCQNTVGACSADTLDIGQADLHTFVSW